MKFTEIERLPEFTLKMSLQETIDLYRIVSWAEESGNKKAEQFTRALAKFSADSNKYNHLKWE